MSTLIQQLPTELNQYPILLDGLLSLSEDEQLAKLANWGKIDLYFLLRYGLNRQDIEKQWLFERCREVQANPDYHLDLWAREHYKSTIITYGLTIQDILNDPDITIGIFSHTRPIAKGFLRQIKREFESNETLKKWYPDILWQNPSKEAPKWSEDEGIVVKRKSNPKEQTVEAWGLVDSQPTSKHYKRLVYDDVVTRESVTTPEMIAKTTEALELSYNLGSEGGKRRFIGTRYHFNDTYKTVMDRGTATSRIYPATLDGSVDGEPTLLSRETLANKRRDMGPYTFGCQMLQNPIADATHGFKREWLRYHKGSDGSGMNIYILVAPANEKKKTSDYTAIEVVGLGADRNYSTLDMVRDRLSLTERADALFRLHKKWRPINVGYEKYGMLADVQHIKDRMERENYRFSIVELGGSMPKNDRIRRLIPVFEQGRWYLPDTLYRTNYEKVTQDLVEIFINEEYLAFPVSVHDDMMDIKARVLDEDLGAVWPIAHVDDEAYTAKPRKRTGWAAKKSLRKIERSAFGRRSRKLGMIFPFAARKSKRITLSLPLISGRKTTRRCWKNRSASRSFLIASPALSMPSAGWRFRTGRKSGSSLA